MYTGLNLADILSKVTYIAFKVYISVHAFPVNQTHEFTIVSAIHYSNFLYST